MFKTGVLLLSVASTLAYPQKDPSLSSEIEQIFGSDKNTSTNAETRKNTPASTEKDLDKIIDDIFGPTTKKFETVNSTTPSRVEGDTDIDKIINEIFGSTTKKHETPIVSSTTPGRVEGDNDLDKIIEEIFGPTTKKSEATTASTTPGRVDGDTGEACVLTNRHGMCARYYECEKEVNINDGEIDIAGGVIDIPCNHYLDVCCLVVNTNKNTEGYMLDNAAGLPN